MSALSIVVVEADIASAVANIKQKEAESVARSIAHQIDSYAFMRGHKIQNIKVVVDFNVQFSFEEKQE